MTQDDISRPVVLGRYELMERIGRGGFSTVYRARDHKMGRQVAVKAIQRTEELSGRAAREARAAAKLSHPHIVTVFELAEDDRNIYLVSELVEGQTLSGIIRDEPLSGREYIEMMRQVLSALDHAHARGVVHRDIKPDNIMLTADRDRQVKVMDFGIARLENTQRLTRQGDVIGTLAYMSPEQADGRGVDSATDVYSAALTLYECLTGANPFRGETAAEIVGRIQAGALPLSHVRPDLPPELSELLEEAMEPDPALRLGIRSLAAGLERVLPELAGGGQATTVTSGDQATTVLRGDEPTTPTAIYRRAEQPRPGVYEDISRRFGFLWVRLANAGLAAMVAAAAVYGSSYYPYAWRLPLVLAAALAVALLPRIGLAPLGVVALLPVAAFSVALGALLAAAAAAYFLTIGLVWPRVALLPALAAGLGWLGLGLVYPAVSGAVGHLRRGLMLALAGGVFFTLAELLLGSRSVDYLGIANNYDIASRLAGEYNPVTAIRALAAPFESEPVIALQPAIWLVASLPAALLIRRRHLLADFGGLVLADGLLAAGYFALPAIFPGYLLPQAAFVKTLLLCVIIQVVLLLISPRTKLEPPFPS